MRKSCSAFHIKMSISPQRVAEFVQREREGFRAAPPPPRPLRTLGTGLTFPARRREKMNDVTDLDLLELDRFAIGQPVPRSEDPLLITGTARFTDDVNLPGQVYAVIVRSHHAHGAIRDSDTAAARGMPGVLGVYT